MKTFEGYDPRVGYSYRYDPDTGLLSIGCTDLTIEQWRLQGEARIQDGLSVCNIRGCTICASNVQRRVYAYVALPKLLDEIEAAEAPEPIVYNESRPRIVLDADVYDTLELSALAFGGIGGGVYGRYDDGGSGSNTGAIQQGLAVPVCAVGHAALAALPGDWWSFLGGETIGHSDRAVHDINERKGKRTTSERNDRVSFAEWVGELNVRRGDV